jgi:chemotaxis response regulator CheB
VKIAIVNDSVLAMEAIRRVLASDPSHSVLWTATTGEEAVARCSKAKPDLILMDMIMPGVDGVEATRRIMRSHPCPILVVTASVKQNSGAVFEAMGAGALDVVATPRFDDEAGRRELLTKIERLEQLTASPAMPAPRKRPGTGEATCAVLIGSSAGGPAALAEILHALPRDLPAAIVLVQHMDARFMPELVSWLDSRSALPVRAAAEGDLLLPGVVLLAASADHLVFRRDGSLGYTIHPEDTPYRPSVDRLFESALTGWTKPMLGVLLTGMGRDGAEGLKRLRDAGHFTIAQDEGTSALYGMPRAAAQLSAASEILPLDRIAGRIAEKISLLA